MSQLIDKDEIKADHYFFWLSEYRTRKFYLTNTIDELKCMVKNFIHNFATYYHISVDIIEKNSFENIISEIYTGQYRTDNVNNCNININLSNANFDNPPEKYNDNIYIEYKKVLSFMEYISDLTFKIPPWRVKEPNAIIDDIINKKNFQFMHTGSSLNKFKNSIRPKARGQRIQWEKQEDGSILFSEMNIDINCDIDLIVKEFQIFLSSVIFSESDKKTGQDARKIEKIYKEYATMYLKKSTDISYTQAWDTSRAIGLWLWDFVKKNNVTISSAIRELQKNSFLKFLGYSESSERVFSRMYAQTDKCIKNGEVLAMS